VGYTIFNGNYFSNGPGIGFFLVLDAVWGEKKKKKVPPPEGFFFF